MKQRKTYVKPEIDLIKLTGTDIITVSDLDIKVDPGENDGEWI